MVMRAYGAKIISAGGIRLKIRVAYTINEQDRKKQHEEAVKQMFPDVKIKDTAPKDGFLHPALTVPKPHSMA